MAYDGAVKFMQSWITRTFVDLRRQFRWSFLPPLMVYFAAGVSGLTAIVGAFFVKEYLGLSATFLAGLGFWAGLPWALKMPLGHLVDVMWRKKGLLVYLGAALIATSLLIMYGLVRHPAVMANYMPVASWYVLSALLAPTGYVIQDTVADAMSVEAVPCVDAKGRPLSEALTKSLHTTMQTFGRIALIGGLVAVATVNIFMFDGVHAMDQTAKAVIYGQVYLLALLIPAISVSGVLLASFFRQRQQQKLRAQGLTEAEVERLLDAREEATKPNYWYFGGGIAFAAMTLVIGLTSPPFAQEIVFAGSMAIVLFLMTRLVKELAPDRARVLVGTAIIIFVFRAVPLPGAGATWFEIDVLGFDQQFLAILSLLASILTLIGMVVLRPMMASRSIAYIVVILTIAAGILSIPNIALYYGIHDWTSPLTGGVVDARFIAVIDTAMESPLGQIAMIPMLAWIAKNAPNHLKATFFAVMASFTNLALSASSLLTKHLNQVFTVTREVRDKGTGEIATASDYSMLGWLLVTVAIVSVAAPLVTIFIVQRSALKTND
ncbi:MAG: hypothetical protein ACI89J_004562 [Hyphomicrobiaceae bacterium]|jgi:hypothetical protein